MATRAELAAARERARVRKARAHDMYVQRTYHLTEGEYDRMLAAQGGVCAICGKTPRKRFLAVDHDHFDQHNRALLCYMCNKALGQFEMSEAVALRASLYLATIAEDHHRRNNEGLHRRPDDGSAGA